MDISWAVYGMVWAWAGLRIGWDWHGCLSMDSFVHGLIWAGHIWPVHGLSEYVMFWTWAGLGMGADGHGLGWARFCLDWERCGLGKGCVGHDLGCVQVWLGTGCAVYRLD
jgi:hypothetical protein